jgi:rhodanese-related sulfurtransferase
MIRLLAKSAKEALSVLVVVFPLALVVNHVRIDGIPLWPRPGAEQTSASPSETDKVISIKEAAERFREPGTLFVDARAPEDYCADHIAGAVNLPVCQFEKHFLTLAEKLEISHIIITYCDGTGCTQGTELAETLEEMGFANVRFLVNGCTEWISSGLPTEKGDQAECSKKTPSEPYLE